MTNRSDDEQLEALKNWWREHGKTTVLGVVAAIALVFGYQAWDQQRGSSREQASMLYQSLLSADLQAQRDGDYSTANHLAGNLREAFPRSGYARFAALFQARYAVSSGDYPAAEEALEWAMQRKPDDGIGLMARLRLAQIAYARGEHEAALQRLQGVDAGAFAFAYESLRGDIYSARGDVVAAREAWQRASLLASSLDTPLRDPLLELKLQDVRAAGERGEG